jgi:hypothetical protein
LILNLLCATDNTVAHVKFRKELFMKKEYSSPEFELVKFKFEDIILTGSLDDTPEATKSDGDDWG